MGSPSSENVSSNLKRPRRREFTVEENVRMKESKRCRQQARKRRTAALQEAHMASVADDRAARHDRRTIDGARSALPEVHEARSFITEEQSQEVIRSMVLVYDVLCPNPKWFATAVPYVAQSTGIGEVMVREIWKTFDETGQFYFTDRPVLSKSADMRQLDASVR